MPKRLYSDDDFEAIPQEMSECVKFGAAELAFAASGRYAQAAEMQSQYLSRIGVNVVSRDRGKTKSYYFQVP